MRRLPRPGRGFSLIDMAILLTVLSILATIMVPRQMERLRNRMAEGAVQQMVAIFDAAKWHWYDNQDAGGNPWPGGGPGPSAVPGKPCSINENQAKAALRNSGFLGNATNFENPWRRPYRLFGEGHYSDELYTTANNCWFTIATEIPQEIEGLFRLYVPNGSCNVPGQNWCPYYPGSVPTGYVRCCGRVPRPGREVKLNESLDAWVPNPDDTRVPCSPFHAAPQIPAPGATCPGP